MKIAVSATLFALTASPLVLQAQLSGVSNPPPAAIETSDTPAPVYTPAKTLAKTPAKPSAAVAVAPAVETAVPTSTTYKPFDPDAEIVTEASYPMPLRPAPTKADDPDAGIVTRFQGAPGSISTGMLLKIHLARAISTETARPGAVFTGLSSEAIVRDGQVLVPAGSQVEGHITKVHGGRRIGGNATLHLKLDSITLPDGTRYPVHAQVIDTDQTSTIYVDREGTILRREHPVATLAAASLATGSGAAAGAVLGGGVGALIGAGIGAGVGTAVWLKQDRQAVLPENSTIVFSFTAPLPVTPSSPESASLR